MTHLAQIRHVMMKDFGEARWQLTVYCAIVALATLHSVGWKGANAEIFGYTMMLVVMFGMITIASIIQGDSPVRADSFWATRPLSPGAVLLAKFAMALVVLIGVAGIGQLAGLLAHHVAGRELAKSMGESFADYGRWLLIAMVFAAVTRDLRTFLLTLVAIPAYYFVSAFAFNGSDFQSTDPASHAAAKIISLIALLTFAAGGVGLLAYLYRARDARARTWVAAIVVFVAGMSFFSPPAEPSVVEVDEMPDGTTVTHQPETISSRPEAIDEAPPSVRRPVITLMASPFHATVPGDEGPRYTLSLDVDSFPANEQLTLQNATATYHMRDGSVFRARVDGSWNPVQFGIHASSTATWLDARDRHPMMDVSMGFPDSLRQAFEKGLTSVSLDGRVAVSVPDAVDTIPLKVGASTARGGTRTTITNISYSAGHATVTLSTSELLLDNSADPQSNSGMSNPSQIDCALVSAAGDEGISLESHGTGYQSGWLVLPGALTRVGSTKMQTAVRYPGNGSGIGDAWFRDARIVITHWAPRGSYPVHSDFNVPATPAPASPTPRR